MPTADTTVRDYTAAEVTAYQAYLSAVAEHRIICARAGASTREKMDAALAQQNAFRRFCETAGFECGRDIRDVSRIKALVDALAELTESIRSAWAMLRAADALGADSEDHDACVCLVSDAQTLLRAALTKADAQ